MVDIAYLGAVPFEREPWTRVAAAGEPVRKNRPSRSRPDGLRVVLDEDGSTSPSTTRVMASPSRVELPGNQATLHPWPGLLAEGASGRGDRVSAATDVAGPAQVFAAVWLTSSTW